MDKSRIIKSAKRQDEEKVGFSLKLPKSVKDQLQTLSEKESVSMNALIVAALQSMIDDECGKELKNAKSHLIDHRNSMQDFISAIDVANGSLDEEIILRYEEYQVKVSEINSILGE